MSMDRRGFLKRFGIGLAAACALAAVPEAVVKALAPAEAARRLACEHMRREWLGYMRGKRAEQCPRELRVSQGLYTAYKGELQSCERYTSGDAPDRAPSLLFKAARVIVAPDVRGWDIRFA